MGLLLPLSRRSRTGWPRWWLSSLRTGWHSRSLQQSPWQTGWPLLALRLKQKGSPLLALLLKRMGWPLQELVPLQTGLQPPVQAPQQMDWPPQVLAQPQTGWPLLELVPLRTGSQPQGLAPPRKGLRALRHWRRRGWPPAPELELRRG